MLDLGSYLLNSFNFCFKFFYTFQNLIDMHVFSSFESVFEFHIVLEILLHVIRFEICIDIEHHIFHLNPLFSCFLHSTPDYHVPSYTPFFIPSLWGNKVSSFSLFGYTHSRELLATCPLTWANEENPPQARHANDNLFGPHFLAKVHILFLSNKTFRCLGKIIIRHTSSLVVCFKKFQIFV
jgi:hypothetical protein